MNRSKQSIDDRSLFNDDEAKLHFIHQMREELALAGHLPEGNSLEDPIGDDTTPKIRKSWVQSLFSKAVGL